MKDHTIWFWLYWGCWLVFSFCDISLNAAGKEPERLFGNIVGMFLIGYVGYRILKWIYDY